MQAHASLEKEAAELRTRSSTAEAEVRCLTDTVKVLELQVASLNQQVGASRRARAPTGIRAFAGQAEEPSDAERASGNVGAALETERYSLHEAAAVGTLTADARPGPDLADQYGIPPSLAQLAAIDAKHKVRAPSTRPSLTYAYAPRASLPAQHLKDVEDGVVQEAASDDSTESRALLRERLTQQRRAEHMLTEVNQRMQSGLQQVPAGGTGPVVVQRPRRASHLRSRRT